MSEQPPVTNVDQFPPPEGDDEVPRPPGPRQAWLRFVAGFATGTLFSLIAWRWCWDAILGIGCVAIVGVPVMKMAFGIALTSDVRWRTFGAGVLLSMAIGALIFAHQCGLAIKL